MRDEYLLDTDICINFLKGKFGVKDKIKEVGISKCYISEITIFELTYGAYKSSNFEKHIKEVEKVKLLFEVIPAYEIRFKYAEARVRLEKEGLRIPDFDLLIGSTSIVYDMVMVTNNEIHLSRIDGIIIENWTKIIYSKFV